MNFALHKRDREGIGIIHWAPFLGPRAGLPLAGLWTPQLPQEARPPCLAPVVSDKDLALLVHRRGPTLTGALGMGIQSGAPMTNKRGLTQVLFQGFSCTFSFNSLTSLGGRIIWFKSPSL